LINFWVKAGTRNCTNFANDIQKTSPRQILINSTIGDCEMRRRRWQVALDHYSPISAGTPEEVTRTLSDAAHCLLNPGRSANAEYLHRSALSRSPHNQQSLRDFTNILLASGRTCEAIPHLNVLIRLEKYGQVDLIFCASPILFYLPGERFAQTCLDAIPDDPRPTLGLARDATRQKNFNFARFWLSDIVNTFPETLEAQKNWDNYTWNHDHTWW